MNDHKASIRINLSTKELEINGSEDFLRTFDRQQLSRLIDVLANAPQNNGYTVAANSSYSFPANAVSSNSKNDEIDNDYLRNFMEGYNNSFTGTTAKKYNGNEASEESIILKKYKKNSNYIYIANFDRLYASLPNHISMNDKTLVAAYYLQATNAKQNFNKFALRDLLKKYKKIFKPNDFFLTHLNNGNIEQQDNENYMITFTGLDYVEKFIS